MVVEERMEKVVSFFVFRELTFSRSRTLFLLSRLISLLCFSSSSSFSSLFLFLFLKTKKQNNLSATQDVHPGARDVVDGPQEPAVDSVVGDPVVADVASERGRRAPSASSLQGGHRGIQRRSPGVPALHPVRLVRRALVERLEVERHADRVEAQRADPPDDGAEVARLRVGPGVEVGKHLVGVVEAEPADSLEVGPPCDDAVGGGERGGGGTGARRPARGGDERDEREGRGPFEAFCHHLFFFFGSRKEMK